MRPVHALLPEHRGEGTVVDAMRVGVGSPGFATLGRRGAPYMRFRMICVLNASQAITLWRGAKLIGTMGVE